MLTWKLNYNHSDIIKRFRKKNNRYLKPFGIRPSINGERNQCFKQKIWIPPEIIWIVGF